MAQRLCSAGYESCASTRIGTVNRKEDLFALKRIPINSGDDLALFAAKLSGAYDWVATLQATFKKVRRFMSEDCLV